MFFLSAFSKKRLYAFRNIFDNIICVLPETKVGKSVQLEVLFFSQKLAETLKSKIKIIEKQFFYDIQPEIAESEVEEKLKQKLKTEIGLSCKIVISSDGKIQFR